MSILAVLDGGSANGDTATQAKRLQEAIELHRTALDTLLDERRRHAIALREAGWSLAPIAALFGLTRERVRQLISAPTQTTAPTVLPRTRPECPHTPVCPPAEAVDREAARTVAAVPEQGWSLLCNGLVVFDDTGDLLPDGSVIEPHRGPAPHRPPAGGELPGDVLAMARRMEQQRHELEQVAALAAELAQRRGAPVGGGLR